MKALISLSCLVFGLSLGSLALPKDIAKIGFYSADRDGRSLVIPGESGGEIQVILRLGLYLGFSGRIRIRVAIRNRVRSSGLELILWLQIGNRVRIRVTTFCDDSRKQGMAISLIPAFLSDI